MKTRGKNPLLVLVVGAFALGCNAPPPEPGPWQRPPGTWELTWSDEFDQTPGTFPDPANWVAEEGGWGWGNDELQFYTDRTENAVISDDGTLVITARREAMGENDYTSARIITRNLFQQKYGRFEARIRLPVGKGLWPAFWLLGSNLDAVGWPECGEIDIMEARGSNPRAVEGSIHGPGYSGASPISEAYSLAPGKSFNEDFHVFALEWGEGGMHFMVDEKVYHSITPEHVEPRRWVFDQPFFIIMNVAVGGKFDGAPDGKTMFPQTMEVDYVRVYRLIEAE